MKSRQNRMLQQLLYLQPISYSIFLKTFIQWYTFLKKSETWNLARITHYQSLQLQQLIRHAYNHVPYYRDLFTSNNITPSEIHTIKDLERIPILTKDHIRTYTHQLQANNYPKTAFYKRTTGGTTGIPLTFFLEKAKWLGIHFAFNKLFMKHAGYHWPDKVISISGIPVPIRHNPLYRTIELSSFYSTKTHFDMYNEQIHRFKPKFITTFPSALLLFTHDLLERKKHIYSHIQAIFCHGETLHPRQKSFLEDIYQCTVYDQYGHREQCVFATTGSSSNHYHVYPQYGIVELVDSKLRPIRKPNKKGEIIATSLTNYIFPFIRYKTEDLSELTDVACSCDLHYPLLHRIYGRTQEFIIGKHDEIIPITGLYHLFSEPTIPIREYQIKQEQKGELIISYVQSDSFSEKDIIKMKEIITDYLGNSFSFTFKPVHMIHRTCHGKYQYLIQNLQVKKYLN